MASKIPDNYFTRDQVMVMAQMWCAAQGPLSLKKFQVLKERYNNDKKIAFAVAKALKLTEVKYNGRIYYEQAADFTY